MINAATEAVHRLNDARLARGGLKKPSGNYDARAKAKQQAALQAVKRCDKCGGRHNDACPNPLLKEIDPGFISIGISG